MPYPGVRVDQGGDEGWDQPPILGTAEGLGGGESQDGIMIAERLHQHTEGDLVTADWIRDGAVRSGTSTLDGRPARPETAGDAPIDYGANVTLGQTVVVLEAMKMENDLAAPRAGTIKEIKVSKGQTVNQGDVLIIIH